jgi:glycosyltransferase involved in cell wall biosynthesis
MESKVDISVIIPMYNSERYIKQAIDSVLNQEEHGLDYEIIVVDDGSIDNSTDVVKSIGSERLKLVELNENGGTANARNTGIRLTRGEWVQFLDSDDRICDDLFRKFERSLMPGTNCYIFSFIREQQEYSLKQTITKVKDKRAFAHFGGTACNKFIRRDICLEFKKDFISEDICFSVDMMTERDLRISLIEDAYYIYNKKNTQSKTSNFKKAEFQKLYSYIYGQIDRSDAYTKMFILEFFIAILFDRTIPLSLRIKIATRTLFKLYKYFPRVVVNQNRNCVRNIKIQ